MKKTELKNYFDKKQEYILLNQFKVKSVEELLILRDNTLNLSGIAKAVGLEIKELVKKLNEMENNISVKKTK